MALDCWVFCDIDGTLLHSPGAGRSAFADAFLEAFGLLPDMSAVNFAGATDLRVLDQLLRQESMVSDQEKQDHFFECLPRYLDRNMQETPPLVFPNVKKCLERILKSASLGLVTGNIRACAWVKLQHAGLSTYFSEVGGFGDDHADRHQMAALALERAGNPSRAFLLGDTPSDIAAAQKNGMVSVAVCNGQFSRDDLAKSAPDLILDSFEKADAFFELLEQKSET
jgi:phosphoglycolate phosphatase-like HAD superfamily hydrolase